MGCFISDSFPCLMARRGRAGHSGTVIVPMITSRDPIGIVAPYKVGRTARLSPSPGHLIKRPFPGDLLVCKLTPGTPFHIAIWPTII